MSADPLRAAAKALCDAVERDIDAGKYSLAEATIMSLRVNALRAALAAPEPSDEYDGAPVADLVNSWCREAHVEEAPSAKWQDVHAAVDRLWAKLGSSRAALAAEPSDEEVARVLLDGWLVQRKREGRVDTKHTIGERRRKFLCDVRAVTAARERARRARCG